MEETTDVAQAPVDEGKTADQLLKEIEQAQGQLEKTETPKPVDIEPSAPQQADQVQPESSDKPAETPKTSEPAQEVSVPGETGKTDDTEEWMKRKGFKSKEDMARSLRNLERELHKRGKDMKQPAVTQFPPVQFNPPMPRNIPNSGLNEVAELYQIPADDLKRLTPLVNDLTAIQLRQAIQPLMSELSEMKRDVQRDKSFKNLEGDPLFQDREVLKEMHELAEADPSILEQPDYPKILFDESLKRIGRRYVESSKSNGQAPEGQRSGIPITPPPAGRGSAGGVRGIPVRPPTAITVDKFQSLPKAEMEKYLKKRGAWKEE